MQKSSERAIQTGRWLASLKPAKVKQWGGMILVLYKVASNELYQTVAVHNTCFLI